VSIRGEFDTLFADIVNMFDVVDAGNLLFAAPIDRKQSNANNH
jgi:hypothetical protein